MYCPFCQAEDTKVIDSRLVADGSQIRRRRECEVCHSRFTTFETIDLALPRVIKSNGERQPFNGSKLKKGMLRALEKRPLSTEEIDSIFGKILKEMYIDSALRREKKYDENNKKSKPKERKAVKNISWNKFKFNKHRSVCCFYGCK